jgi:asparagine synthase (glutamine-hydrolysing)
MCGICGIVGFEDKNLLKKMCDVISHRGPDDSGMYLNTNIALGHRRLSIIDLKSGHQPIHNEDESIWIIYNGEVYNYLELRKDLEKQGHKFYTSSDTEVAVHLYEEFGDFCVKRLRGMFAFAIWDSNKEKLLLARDRIGIKPLYYTIHDGNFLFSSEIKSILQYEELKRGLNYTSLHHFFTYRVSTDSETIIKDIKKLLPGHILIFMNRKIKINQYWSLNIDPLSGKAEKYFFKRFQELLEESVRMRLMSDVPLGAYLSGGVDSSSVVSLMSSLVDDPIKTISVGFGEPTDELEHAQLVADHFGTDHHELMVQYDNVPKLLPKIIWHMDEPVADPAIVPTYLMSELAKKHVTVILTGEGADELFAGYPKHKIMSPYLKFIPESIRRKIYSYFPPSMVFTEKEKRELYSDRLLYNTKGEKSTEEYDKRYFKNTNMHGLLNQALEYEIKFWLPNYLLMKVDKMTMAHAVEARVPFLDHKLVEFSGTLPSNLKLRGLTGKYILRKSMSNILPNTIVKRKKHAFQVPLAKWFKGELKEVALQILSDFSLPNTDYFDRVYIQNIFKKYEESRNPLNKLRYCHQLWVLLVFALWHQIYIKNYRSYKIKI